MISGCDNKKIIVYQVVENKELKRLETLSDHTGMVEHILFIHNDQFASTCTDKFVNIWNSDHQLVKSIQTQDIVTAIVYSNRLSLLACGFKSGTIILYDHNFNPKFNISSPNGSVQDLAFADF